MPRQLELTAVTDARMLTAPVFCPAGDSLCLYTRPTVHVSQLTPWLFTAPTGRRRAVRQKGSLRYNC